MELPMLIYMFGLLISVTRSVSIDRDILNELFDEIKQLKTSVAENTDQIHALSNALHESKAKVVELENKLRQKDELIVRLQKHVFGTSNFQWPNKAKTTISSLKEDTSMSTTNDSVNINLTSTSQPYSIVSNSVKDIFAGGDTGSDHDSNILNSRGRDIPVFHRRDIAQQNSTAPRGRIAFSVSLSITPTELGREHTIPFDKILVNSGNGFNIVTHMFECPVNGVYFFHAALSSVYHDYIETELVRDGVILARMYAAGDTREFPFGFDQGANAIVTMCNVGEHVWVRVREHVGTALSTGEFTTFAGFLLFEL